MGSTINLRRWVHTYSRW